MSVDDDDEERALTVLGQLLAAADDDDVPACNLFAPNAAQWRLVLHTCRQHGAARALDDSSESCKARLSGPNMYR